MNNDKKRFNKKIKVISIILVNLALWMLLFIGYFLYDNYKRLQEAFKNNILKVMWRSFNNYWWITITAFLVVNLFMILIYWVIPKLFKRVKVKNNDYSKVWMYNEVKNLGDKKEFDENYRIKKPFKEGFNENSGWVIKANLKEGYILSENQTLILGGTGSGKSQKIIIPSIFYNMMLKDDKKPNMVITDLKGELTSIFAKPLKNHGYSVKVLDLIKLKNSMGFNVFSSIWDLCFKDKNKVAFDEAFKQIDILVYNLKKWNLAGNSEEFWARGGIEILYNLICAMLLMGFYFKDDFKKEDFNFNNLLGLLDINTFKNGAWFYKLFDRQDLSKEFITIKNSLLSYINLPEKQLAGHLGFSTQAVLPYVKESWINNLVLTDEIKINELFDNNKSKPFAVLIKIPEDDETRSSIAINFILQLYQKAINVAEDNDNGKLYRNLFYFLDEFGNLPAIPGMQTKLSAGRGRGIFFACVLQSLTQLEDKYKDAGKTIKDVFNSWIFLGGINNQKTLEEISSLIGKEEYKKTSTTTGSSTKSETSSTQERQAIEMAELQKLRKNQILILQKQEKALLLNIKFAYEYLKYNQKDGTEHLKNNLKDVLIREINFMDFKISENSNLNNKELVETEFNKNNNSQIVEETNKMVETIKNEEKPITINDLIKYIKSNVDFVKAFLSNEDFELLMELLNKNNNLTSDEKQNLKVLLIKVKPFYMLYFKDKQEDVEN
ncbi:conjugal transfer coupling protein TraG [Mycoplasmopsis maculosa]|uniref:Conjugal transfer coupling protein TraG n=1 Tax=Mycoplasmopsis maculosa TaxID=114885 RepID=A0A449B494_9BACT|nr:type IV secretory system conjugative DNA transfer family protein [Mycoplasmopsis maculosa]VEU75389.1 conjugal transfer coupling protein TraG [Mycoplasmopsis maculosa]